MGRGLGFSVAALLLCGGCSGQDAPPAADVKGEMLQHVQPAAQTYWSAVQYISDEMGQREITPQTDAEWNEVVEAARKLKDYGAVLKKPEYAVARGTDWQDYANGMIEVAGEAEAAALSHSPERVLEVGGTLYNVCSACHEVYMPSPAGAAPNYSTDASSSS